MSKFKVGDIVRGIDNTYTWTNKYMTRGEVVKTFEPRTMCGDDMRVKILEAPGNVGVEFNVKSKYFELVTPVREFIVIRRSGSDVIASHKRGDEIVKTAKATCAPSDEFNFETGAKLAFDRLMGRQNIDEAIKAWNEPSPAPEPKYYTGKVFAVRAGSRFRSNQGTESRNGHVFEIKDGRLVKDYSEYGVTNNFPPFESFSDFCESYYCTEWAEVKD